jgi:hypothetical protein
MTWYLNGTPVQYNNSTSGTIYYNDSSQAIGANYNLTLNATNGVGSDTHTWDWTVLENWFDCNVTYYDEDNWTKNIIFEVSNATAGLQSINISYNGTQKNNDYYGYIDLETDEEINNLSCSADGQTLWLNSTNVSNNTWFINETGTLDTKFEYYDYDNTTWAEGPENYYIYHPDVFWWHNLHANYGQAYDQPTLRITNNGTGAGIPYMWINETYNATMDSELEIWIDNDPLKNGDTISLGWGEANKTAVHTELGPNENITLWNWVGCFGLDGEVDINITAEVQ